MKRPSRRSKRWLRRPFFSPPAPASPPTPASVKRHFAGRIPIFGVCLGHQAICEAFGGVVSYASRLMHGKTSTARLDTGSRIFSGMPEQIPVARYHSLAAVRDTLPACLRVIAETDDGEIMAVEHTEYPVSGVQFHPESVMTPDGLTIIKNFLEECNHD